jgi:hypothetical protein
MKNAIRSCAATMTLVFVNQLLAGGFYLLMGNPEASPEAKKLNAVVTIEATGCHDPALAKLTATAIGVVNGERREIPLNLEALSKPGMFALTRQWPKDGRWVIRVEATNGTQFTNSLVPIGPEGVDRNHRREDLKRFTAADVDTMLRP